MFSKKNNHPKTPTIVSSKTVICGDIASTWCVDISGKIVGNVQCDYLVLRQGGIIQGDVTANDAIIDGNISGIVQATRIHLKKNASIEGSVVYEYITADQGSRISGQLMHDKQKVLEAQESKYITATDEQL